LEALKADRKGQHSIRVNDPWRICCELLDEIHPGEILFEDFMKPMGISARRLAADIDVSPSRISELVDGQRPITADTALRLGLFFGMEPRFLAEPAVRVRHPSRGPGTPSQALAENPCLSAGGGVTLRVQGFP
jgi:addiction module HigA family antidote